MAKITRHICDFNNNLPEHDSHWFITVRTKAAGEEGSKEFDICSEHLIPTLTPIFNNNGFRDITVRKSSEVPTETIPPVGVKVSGKGSGKVATCLECGKEFKNLYSHVTSIHGMEWKGYTEKHGLPFREVVRNK